MNIAFVLLLILGTALAATHVNISIAQQPITNPADVTYIDGKAPADLKAGPNPDDCNDGRSAKLQLDDSTHHKAGASSGHMQSSSSSSGFRSDGRSARIEVAGASSSNQMQQNANSNVNMGGASFKEPVETVYLYNGEHRNMYQRQRLSQLKEQQEQEKKNQEFERYIQNHHREPSVETVFESASPAPKPYRESSETKSAYTSSSSSTASSSSSTSKAHPAGHVHTFERQVALPAVAPDVLPSSDADRQTHTVVNHQPKPLAEVSQGGDASSVSANSGSHYDGSGYDQASFRQSSSYDRVNFPQPQQYNYDGAQHGHVYNQFPPSVNEPQGGYNGYYTHGEQHGYYGHQGQQSHAGAYPMQPVVTKTIQIAQPALKAKKFEVRHPAIQKQFYDIEERVVIKPAGTVVVELDHPVAKIPKGETILPLGRPHPAVAGAYGNNGQHAGHHQISTSSSSSSTNQGSSSGSSYGPSTRPGYGPGYGSNSGSNSGHSSGSSYGSNSGHNSGSNSGHSSGSNSGSSYGSNTGHSSGSSPSYLPSSGPISGSNSGSSYGSNSGHSSGSNTGHSSGSNTGSSYGSHTVHSSGSTSGSNSGSSSGSNTGSSYGSHTVHSSGSTSGSNSGSSYGSSSGHSSGSNTGHSSGSNTGHSSGSSYGSHSTHSSGSSSGSNSGSGSGGMSYSPRPVYAPVTPHEKTVVGTTTIASTITASPSFDLNTRDEMVEANLKRQFKEHHPVKNDYYIAADSHGNLRQISSKYVSPKMFSVDESADYRYPMSNVEAKNTNSGGSSSFSQQSSFVSGQYRDANTDAQFKGKYIYADDFDRQTGPQPARLRESPAAPEPTVIKHEHNIHIAPAQHNIFLGRSEPAPVFEQPEDEKPSAQLKSSRFEEEAARVLEIKPYLQQHKDSVVVYASTTMRPTPARYTDVDASRFSSSERGFAQLRQEGVKGKEVRYSAPYSNMRHYSQQSARYYLNDSEEDARGASAYNQESRNKANLQLESDESKESKETSSTYSANTDTKPVKTDHSKLQQTAHIQIHIPNHPREANKPVYVAATMSTPTSHEKSGQYRSSSSSSRSFTRGSDNQGFGGSSRYQYDREYDSGRFAKLELEPASKPDCDQSSEEITAHYDNDRVEERSSRLESTSTDQTKDAAPEPAPAPAEAPLKPATIAEIDPSQIDVSLKSTAGHVATPGSRVIAATPAPTGASSASESFHKRRIVVNHPFQTVREVVEHEPITNYHQVQVNEPAHPALYRESYTQSHSALRQIHPAVYHRSSAIPVRAVAVRYSHPY